MTQKEIKKNIAIAINALNNVYVSGMNNVQNMNYAMSTLYETYTKIQEEEEVQECQMQKD